MVFSFVRWWYGRGWQLAVARTGKRARGIARQLSAGQLLGSLFSPWHRIVSVGGRGLAMKFEDALGNLVSRAVGFVARLLVLFVALLAFAGIGIAAVIEIIGWPLVPFAFIYCVARGITG